MSVQAATGTRTWPRWLPFLGFRTRDLDDRACAELGTATGRHFRPGPHDEFAIEWFGVGVGSLPVRAPTRGGSGA